MKMWQGWRVAGAIRNILAEEGLVASAAVVNAEGALLWQFRMPGARAFTLNVARLKAEQAASTGKRTRQLRDQVAEESLTPEVLGIAPAEFIKWAGGVPIYDSQDSRLIGGAGVSNLPEDDDERVCMEGIRRAGLRVDPADEVEPYSNAVSAISSLNIGLPGEELLAFIVGQMVECGAVVIERTEGPVTWLLRLNPEDTLQVRLYVKGGKPAIVVTCQTELNPATLRALHPTAMVIQDPPAVHQRLKGTRDGSFDLRLLARPEGLPK